MIELVLAIALLGGPPPEVSTGTIESAPHTLVEIHTTPQPPEGFVVLGQEWLVLDTAVDWRQYDNGSVFVATAPPGTTYQARWRCQYLQLDPVEGRSEWRVYTVHVRGPPVVTEPTDPVQPPDPTVPQPATLVGIVYESSTTRLPNHLLTAVRKLREQGVEVRVIDRDVVTGLGSVPAELQPLLAAAGDDQLSLIVGDAAGNYRSVPLPATEDGILAEAQR